MRRYPILWIVNSKSNLSEEEETKIRSIIGSLQWAATAHRPDLGYHLAVALGRLNRERSACSIIDANNFLAKYKRYSGHKLVIAPVNLETEYWRLRGTVHFKCRTNKEWSPC